MTPKRLREIYGDISPRAAVKTIDLLDTHCIKFIENSPFCTIATSDGARLDVSPKGDPAGFIKILDDKNIIIPDRPGNNRIDGLLNILNHPYVALLFLIPSVNETLRVNGKAIIIEDIDLCKAHAINGRIPKTITKITVEEVFLHCGKAPLRGSLWKAESWPAGRPIPNLNQIIKDHAGDNETPQMTDTEIEIKDKETLY